MSRWRGRAHTALGAAVMAGLLAAFPAAMAYAPRDVDLAVRAPGPAPHRVDPTGHAPLDDVEILPASVRSRLELAGDVAAEGPGLAFRTWRVTYGGRWERELTLPVLRGPFAAEGTPWACGLAIRVGAGVFDTRGAGAGLGAKVDRMIRRAMPANLPLVRASEVRFQLEPGRVRVHALVTLIDGSRIAALFYVRPGEDRGRLVLRRDGAVNTSAEGGVIESALPPLAGWLRRIPLVGGVVQQTIDGEVNRRVTESVDHGLAEVEVLPDDWAPLPDRPGDRVDLRLQGPPAVTADGIAMTICPVVRLAPPRVDASIPGPVVLPAAAPELPRHNPADVDPAYIEIAVTPGLANQVLYLLWQSGQLRRWGHRAELLAAVPAQVHDLALTVDGFDPRLPPVITPSDDPQYWRVTAGDVAIGTLAGQRVVGHAELLATVGRQPRGLRLVARQTRPRINCVASQSEGTAWQLNPCMSDLAPVLRERVESDMAWPLDDAMLERLAVFDFRGVTVRLSRMTARLEGALPQLRLVAHAETAATASPPRR